MPLQFAGAAGHRVMPQVAAVVVEDQLWVAAGDEPVVPRDLALELTRCPTRIAKGDQALLWPHVVADRAQHLFVRGHRQAGADREGVGIVVVGAVHHKAEFGLHWAALKHHQAALDPGGPIAGRFQKAFDRALFERAIDDDAKGAALVLTHHQDHRVIEARVAHGRRRDQELPDERAPDGRAGVGRLRRRRAEQGGCDQHTCSGDRQRARLREPGECHARELTSVLAGRGSGAKIAAMTKGKRHMASEAWTISTAVGTGERGFAGDGGPAARALLNGPFDIDFDASGNLYFSDTFNHRIRRVDRRTGLIGTIAGNGEAGYRGDGGPATQAAFNEPYGIAVDRAGNIYVADRHNHCVRRIDGASGIVTTFAGNGGAGYSGDGGAAARASLVEPNGLAFDQAERRLFIADVADNRVRVVDLAAGTIATFAGTGEAAHSGDGGPAPQAGVWGARAVKVAADGRVYILERQGSSLRAVDPATGVIATVAGTGARGYSGDGGPALAAVFDAPKEMTIEPDGDLLIVDTENHAIRRIDRTSGIVETIAGGRKGAGGDGGPATAAGLGRPHGVAVGPDGAIYIGDTENHRIRKLTPSPGRG